MQDCKGRKCRRRQGLRAAFAAALLLTGCSSDVGPWSDYVQIIRQGLSGTFKKQSVTRQQAAAIPYASLGFRINGGNEQILVLATDSNNDLLWTAASHIVFLTHGGRIVRTVGLPNDRGGLRNAGSGELPPLLDAVRGPYRSVRTVDMAEVRGVSITLSCTTSSMGPQRVSILGTVIATVRVDEQCQSQSPRWHFTDSYWVDPQSGFVWHSVQNIHPAGTTIQIEVFRPPE